MNNQLKNMIPDWGIEDLIPISPIVHFQPLKFLNESILSHRSHTNSVSSVVSQNDYGTEGTSIETASSTIIEKSHDYGISEMVRLNEEDECFKLLQVARQYLMIDEMILKPTVDQFNYTIITSELLTIDTRLKFLKTSELPKKTIALPFKNGVKLTGFSIKCDRVPITRIIFLLIASLRYLIRHGPNELFIRIITSIIINRYSQMRLMLIKLQLNKVMMSLGKYMNSSITMDNKIIKMMNSMKNGDIHDEIASQLGVKQDKISIQQYLIFKNGISLLTINFNNKVRKLLPNLDISSLERYLNIYKLDFLDKEMDFIWILNHSDLSNYEDEYKKFQIGQDLVQKKLELEKLIKNYVIIRKFFLCCLLSLGDSTDKEDFFFRQILESKFNVSLPHQDDKSLHLRLDNAIDALSIESSISQLTDNLDDHQAEKNNEWGLRSHDTETTYDRLILRMDKIVNNMKYLRYSGHTIYDKQVGLDLQNLMQFYELIVSRKDARRSVSNPDRKRNSMPYIPKQRQQSQRKSVNGLSFNLLSAVMEDGNDHSSGVSYDDNYVQLGHDTQLSHDYRGDRSELSHVLNVIQRHTDPSEHSVIIHDIAHSTMLDIDTSRHEEMISAYSSDTDSDTRITALEMKDKLNSTFTKLYN